MSEIPFRLQPGVLIGSYRLDMMLGEGGQSQVWRAIDPSRADDSSQGYVAIKVLPPEQKKSDRELNRVRETFRAAQALQHPNICPIYSLDSVPGFDLVLVMKYIDGGNLLDYRDRYVAEHGDFPLNEVVRILNLVAKALDYAHSPQGVHQGLRSVVHRDVKPENILIGADGGEVQVVDYGLAAQVRMLSLIHI